MRSKTNSNREYPARSAAASAGTSPVADRMGLATVEVAVIAPCAIFIIVAMLDVGLATYSSNTMAEAVRAGARYAIVHGSNSESPIGPAANSDEVAAVVKSYAPGIPAAQLEVTSSWPDGTNQFGNRVTVTAAYNYKSTVAWLIGKSSIALVARSTMEISH